MRHEELDHLKVGDRVIVHGSMNSKSMGTIERITKTLFIVNEGKLGNGEAHITRFNRSSGFQPHGNDSWNLRFIRPATEEALTEIKRERHRSKINKRLQQISFMDLSDEGLETVYKIIVKELGDK